MKSLRVALTILAAAFAAPAASFTVFSGASYQPVVAPNSWAVAFGTQLALTTATAELSSSGQWPTTLAGIGVQVDGQAAEVYYVSPTQINFLIPNVTDFGPVTVVISNTNGATLTSTVNLQNTSVGIFSSDSTGSGPGAILNGVTNAGPPFLVATPENGGGDLRTRLAVYCTGLRYAGNPAQNASMSNVAANVQAFGRDAAGNQYNFTVEYAGGSDPGFPGLDQVNLVLPAQLDGAGVVSLVITAENVTSNTVTFQVNSLPASQIALTAISLSASEVTGGATVTGTVSLNGLARAGGFPVSIRSSNATVTAPNIVTIPQGQVSTTFNISTPTVGTVQSTTITAQANGISLTAPLQFDPANLPTLNLFTVTPPSAQGGDSLTATVGLSALAPIAGVKVQLAGNDPVAQPPATITIPPNSSSATATISTSAVTAVHNVTFTATLGNTSLTQQVQIEPPIQLTVSPDSVIGGASVTGTITLGDPAPSTGVSVSLTSNGTAFASMPAIVTIGPSQVSATFSITTSSVTSAHTVTITATAAGVGSATATLTVSPQTAGVLQSVAVSPKQVSGGTAATGTVTLSGPAGLNGLTVALRSSNPLVATVPFTVQVPQGSTSATFTIMTSRVASTQSVTITATAGSVSETATLTVQ